MEDLQIFSNSEFGEIRTITKDDEPMFCLADVHEFIDTYLLPIALAEVVHDTNM